jgi:hypothetical protein
MTLELIVSKVLLKFLKKVEIDVESVFDGVQCTDKVFAQPHGYFSIILVSFTSARLGSHTSTNALSSAIFICLTKTVTKLARIYGNGSAKTSTTISPLLH